MMSPIRGTSVLAFEHAHTLRQLWRSRHAGSDALRRFQVRKLRALVAHARNRVAAYREHWRDTRLRPEEITAPESIEALPTIEKDDLRARPLADTLVDGADVRRLFRHMTSGSSGKPFTIYRSAREEHLLNLFRLQASARAGLRLFDRIARFSQLPLDEIRRGWPGRFRQALGIHREVMLNGMAPAEEMIEQLVRNGPDVVCGYPSTLQQLAAGMQQLEPHGVRPRLVLCGGEVLGATARRAIEHAFSAPLVDFYGAHEFNLLASQCPQGDAYHVCDDNVLVEVVGEDGRTVQVGETGEIVATALHSYTMPFVRYRTGDLAVRGPAACPCGQQGSTLRAIQGRAVDCLRLPGRRRVHPYAITGHLAEREAGWVWQHQLVQTDTSRVVLNIQSARTPRSEEIERLRAFGAGILGADVAFDVTLVEGFARQPGGKFRPYVSLMEKAEGAGGEAAA